MNRHIIFDLDETIGFFKQFVFILNIAEATTTPDYDMYFELFEECFRPHIFDIFRFILKKRQSKHLKYIILYTNNKQDFFIQKVIRYMNKKTKAVCFDYIITFNTKRLHKHKSYEDLLHCVPTLSRNDELLFIDDKAHTYMKHPKVVYFKCEKYIRQWTRERIQKTLSSILTDTTVAQKLNAYVFLEKELPKSIYEGMSKKMLHTIEIFIYGNALF
jgi:hypothetical protein